MRPDLDFSRKVPIALEMIRKGLGPNVIAMRLGVSPKWVRDTVKRAQRRLSHGQS